MVNSDRIKEEFITQGFTVASAGATIYTNSINGEILEVKAQSNRAGSVSIYESGNSSNLFFNRGTISGANAIYTQPRALAQAPLGSSAGYGDNVPFITNGPLVINIGSVASGTTTNFNFRVRYR